MKSVVICGSKRFAKEIAKFASDLEKLGVLVFEPNFKEPMPEDMELGSEHIKQVVFKGLTYEHFDWIRKADVCFIYNKNDYCGVSVSLEMGFANALGKPTYGLNHKTGDPCRDSLIDAVAKNPAALVEILS